MCQYHHKKNEKSFFGLIRSDYWQLKTFLVEEKVKGKRVPSAKITNYKRKRKKKSDHSGVSYMPVTVWIQPSHKLRLTCVLLAGKQS